MTMPLVPKDPVLEKAKSVSKVEHKIEEEKKAAEKNGVATTSTP